MQQLYSDNKEYTLYQKKSLERSKDFDIKNIMGKWIKVL
jgi:hypothetical protein